MLDDDLRHRAQRLIAGDFRTGDLDRLFLGQRERAWGRAAFKEVGDFVAHRDTREKGLITQVGRDVFTSIDVWSLKMRGRQASWDDVSRAAQSNLRLASDQQIRAVCGFQRGTAKKRMQAALDKVGRQEKLTEPEIKVLNYLGNSFIWRPAFTSEQLSSEFTDVLSRNKIAERKDLQAAPDLLVFLSLYSLSVMHGSTIVLDDTRKARLHGGFANRDNLLEIKIEIEFEELGKPLIAPICLFLTDLKADHYCEQNLLASEYKMPAAAWDFPIDVTSENRLVSLGG